MPSYVMQAAYVNGMPQTAGTTEYHPPCGDEDYAATIDDSQGQARDSYTWSGLYVYITVASDGVTTYTSQVNGAGGNQAVSVAALATGVFQDLVNSDALVSGDLFCWEGVVPGSQINLSILGSLLTTPTNTSPILITCYAPGNVMAGGTTRYSSISGYIAAVVVENDTKVTWRTIATLSNLRTYVSTNTIANASTLTLRKNGGNGNQSVSVGAGLTGSFEDAVNTDDIAAADELNYIRIGGAGTGSIRWTLIQMKSNSAGQQLANTAGIGTIFGGAAGTMEYLGLTGFPGGKTTTEAWAQQAVQAIVTAKYMFVRLTINAVTVASTVYLRKNGANGNTFVSIPALTTGVFEDLVNSDALVAVGLVNIAVTSGDAGAHFIQLNCVSIELDPSGAAGADIPAIPLGFIQGF